MSDVISTLVKSRILIRQGKVEEGSKLLLDVVQDDSVPIRLRLNALGLLLETKYSTDEIVRILRNFLREPELSFEDYMMISRKFIELRRRDDLIASLQEMVNNPSFQYKQRLSALRLLKSYLAEEEFKVLIQGILSDPDSYDFPLVLSFATDEGEKAFVVKSLKDSFLKADDLRKALKYLEYLYQLEGEAAINTLREKLERVTSQESRLLLLIYMLSLAKADEVREIAQEILSSPEYPDSLKLMTIVALELLSLGEDASQLAERFLSAQLRANPLMAALTWRVLKTFGFNVDLKQKLRDEISAIMERGGPHSELLLNLLVMWVLEGGRFPLEELNLKPDYDFFEELQIWLSDREFSFEMSADKLASLKELVAELQVKPHSVLGGVLEETPSIELESTLKVAEETTPEVTGEAEELQEVQTVEQHIESPVETPVELSEGPVETAAEVEELETSSPASESSEGVADEKPQEEQRVIPEAEEVPSTEATDLIQEVEQLTEVVSNLSEISEGLDDSLPSESLQVEESGEILDTQEVEEELRDLEAMLSVASEELAPDISSLTEGTGEPGELEGSGETPEDVSERESSYTEKVERVIELIDNFETEEAIKEFQGVVEHEPKDDEELSVKLRAVKAMKDRGLIQEEHISYLLRDLTSLRYDVKLLAELGEIVKELGFDDQVLENMRDLIVNSPEVETRAKGLLVFYKLFPEEAKELFVNRLFIEPEDAALEIADWLILDESFKEDWGNLLKRILELQGITLDMKLKLLEFSRDRNLLPKNVLTQLAIPLLKYDHDKFIKFITSVAEEM